MSYNLVYSKLLNQNYTGHAEQCNYTFTVNKPDQLGAYWTARESLEAHIAELQEQGSIILEYELWEDKAPTWSTDYYCIIVASASPLFWSLLILGALALIFGLLVVIPVIKMIKEITEYVGPVAATAVSFAIVGIIGITLIGMIYLMKPKLPKGKPSKL